MSNGTRNRRETRVDLKDRFENNSQMMDVERQMASKRAEKLRGKNCLASREGLYARNPCKSPK